MATYENWVQSLLDTKGQEGMAKPVRTGAGAMEQMYKERADEAMSSPDKFPSENIQTPEQKAILDQEFSEIKSLFDSEKGGEVVKDHVIEGYDYAKEGLGKAKDYMVDTGKSLTKKFETASPEGQLALKENFTTKSTKLSGGMGQAKGNMAAMAIVDAETSPKPRLNKGEQQQVDRELKETKQEMEAALEDEDLFTKIITGYGYPEAAATEAWNLMKKVPGVEAGANMIGDAAGAVWDGMNAINDNMDWLTMLAQAAAVGQNPNSTVATALVQGLAAGYSSQQNKMASAAAQKRKQMLEDEELKIKQFNAQTSRQEADLKSQTLNAQEVSQSATYAEDSGVSQSDIQSAMTILKSQGKPITKKALGSTLKEMGVEQGKYWGVNSTNLI